MKKHEISVGGHYLAKVSGRVVTVRVDAVREVSKYRRNNYSGESVYGSAAVYDVTNLATGRRTTFRSAAKFRGKAKPTEIVGAGIPRKTLAKIIEDRANRMASDNERWARDNPGAAARADALTKVTPDMVKVLERLRDGGVAAAKLVRSTRVSLREMEKDLGLIDYDGDEWNLTERGLEALKILSST